MRGETPSQCYNPEISGEWKKVMFHTKKLFLSTTQQLKKIAKEKRKTSSESKAAALLSRYSELRLRPQEAGNPTAAQAAIAAVAFDLGATDSPPTQASSYSGILREECERNRVFVALYNRMDSKESEEFKLMYEPRDSSDTEEE